jgi:hypothetical protein
MRKHQPYRKNNGFWSCGLCHWEFQTRPSKDNCPGILRIAQATDEYKTRKQWRKLGFEVIPDDELGDRRYDAISIIHSTDWHGYYHRDHVRRITQLAPDSGYAPAKKAKTNRNAGSV